MPRNNTESHKEDILLGERRTDKPIRFKAIKNIYWDDWGRKRLVFRKDGVYNGIQHSDGNVTAFCDFYEVSDYVDMSEIEILS